MKLATFTAENASAAIALVHQNLGPDAVIVSVRKVPAQGFSRLLSRNGQIEVTAAVPQTPRHSVPPGVDAYVPFGEQLEEQQQHEPQRSHRWRSIAWLESLGLLAEFADRLETKVRSVHGAIPPPMPIAEWNAVRDTLATFWRPAKNFQAGTGRPHVFIGPPGSGKTTALCKWLTSSVLRGENRARVWRLDGETANTSEFLSIHAEMIGVPVDRFWGEPAGMEDLLFVDLPGVDYRHQASLKMLRELLFSLPQPHLHLVLNAAYDTTILFEQFNAFAPFMPEDVIFTHLDEEPRRVKLWNFVLGTNCSLSWLSGGQKIPGEFNRAESSLLFPHTNPR